MAQAGPNTGARRLRELLRDPEKMIVCPGVYDGLTARIALSQGFDAIYMVRNLSPSANESYTLTNLWADKFGRLELAHRCLGSDGLIWDW